MIIKPMLFASFVIVLYSASLIESAVAVRSSPQQNLRENNLHHLDTTKEGYGNVENLFEEDMYFWERKLSSSMSIQHKLRHIVLYKFSPDVSEAEIDQSFQAYESFVKKLIGGVLSFSWGSNTSAEGLNQGYTHSLVIDFDSSTSRDVFDTCNWNHAFLRDFETPVLAFDYNLWNSQKKILQEISESERENML